MLSDQHDASTDPVQADRQFFGRRLVICQSREMNLRHVLSFSLGSLPWSLASLQGNLAKTTKSKLLPLLEDLVNPMKTFTTADTATATIVDGMDLLQLLQSP